MHKACANLQEASALANNGTKALCVWQAGSVYMTVYRGLSLPKITEVHHTCDSVWPFLYEVQYVRSRHSNASTG